MTLKVYEVESGFRNRPNGICFAENYDSAKHESNSIITPYLISVPDEYEYTSTADGHKALYYNGHHIALSSINHTEKHVTGISIRGFHRFEIEEG